MDILIYMALPISCFHALNPLSDLTKFRQSQPGASFFDSYANLAQMTAYLASLADTYSMASLVNVGTTLEGRNITGVHICSTPNCEDKPAIVFNGCQHARLARILQFSLGSGSYTDHLY